MSIQTGSKGTWTRATPWLGEKKDTQAVWPRYVCRNPSCKSYGFSHPHCNCGAPGGGRTDLSGHQTGLSLAHGGEVNHCSTMMPHNESCSYYADGGEIEANQEFLSNPPLAVDHAISQHGLLHALTKLGHSKSENENKSTEDFIDSSHRGRKSVSTHMEHHFDKKHDDVDSDPKEVEALKAHLDALRENPSSLLDVGGNLNLPGHRAALAATAATASNYLNSLKPPQAQSSPLDMPMPVDKMSDDHYTRQVGIAQSPLSILSRVKNGSVQPGDLETLQTIYPHLVDSIKNKAGESLIEAKTNETEIPYKHKIGLSTLLGQPLDSTMTLQAMQAIIASAGNQQSNQPQIGKGKKSGATASTLKQVNKTDDLALTNLQAVEAREKKT